MDEKIPIANAGLAVNGGSNPPSTATPTLPEVPVPPEPVPPVTTPLGATPLTVGGAEMPGFPVVPPPAMNVAAEASAKQIIDDGGKKGGQWVWMVVLLLFLICGGVGYWLYRVGAFAMLTGGGAGLGGAEVSVTPMATPTTVEEETGIKQLEEQGASDEIGAIEKDVNASDYSNLTGELDKMGQELAQ